MIRDFSGKSPKIAPSAFVSEAAYVVGDVEIGENSSVWPGAVIRGDEGKIVIGESTSVQDNCVIHTDGGTIIGDNVTIAHSVVVHCPRVGNYVLIGNNATILSDAEIGNFCMVGAGSLVSPGTKIPDKSLVVGMPARIKSEISSEQLASVKEASQIYMRLAQKYKQQGL